MSNDSLGRKVRTVRVWLGVKQQELADRAGIKRAYISQFENDETMLTPENLKAVKGALGINELNDPIEKILSELSPIEPLALAA